MILFALGTLSVIAIGCGTFLAAVGLLFAWLMTGRKVLLIAAILVVVCGVGTLVASALIVTDEERIEQEIYDVAKDVERNDLNAVLEHMHPDAKDIIQEAKSRLPVYNFDGILVRFRRVEINETQTPRTAAAHFIVTVSGAHKSTSTPIPNAAKGYFEVEMVEQGDRWLIRGYKLRNFMEAFQEPK